MKVSEGCGVNIWHAPRGTGFNN